MEMMEARVQKAASLGCDAVEPDNMDVSHASPWLLLLSPSCLPRKTTSRRQWPAL